jgi:hypothetical protein
MENEMLQGYSKELIEIVGVLWNGKEILNRIK